jgi:hypothetical protein
MEYITIVCERTLTAVTKYHSHEIWILSPSSCHHIGVTMPYWEGWGGYQGWTGPSCGGGMQYNTRQRSCSNPSGCHDKNGVPLGCSGASSETIQRYSPCCSGSQYSLGPGSCAQCNTCGYAYGLVSLFPKKIISKQYLTLSRAISLSLFPSQ